MSSRARAAHVAVFAILGWTSLAGAAGSVTFTVNSEADDIDADTADGVCNTTNDPVPTCTLRAAVMQGNRVTGSANARIVLPAGTYHLTRPIVSEIDGESQGDLNLRPPTSGDPIFVIEGAGAATTIIDPGSQYRALRVEAGRFALITGVTIQSGASLTSGGGILNEGVLFLEDVTIRASQAATVGGGIASKGQLNLSRCRVTSNYSWGQGGGISQEGGSLYVIDSVVDHNFAQLSGGGIITYAGGGLQLYRSSIDANQAATQGGGGIAHLGGSLYVDDTLFSGNLAANSSGGGLLLQGQPNGPVEIERSTFADNRALYGGGIASTTGVAKVRISTISGNRANASGGGLTVTGGAAVRISSSTILGNVADFDASSPLDTGGGLYIEPTATVVAGNTIVAGNLRSVTPDDCVGQMTVFGAMHYTNLAVLGPCTLSAGGGGASIFHGGLDEIGPLANNGGRTPTHALLPGSHIIFDLGDPLCLDAEGDPITTDQRRLPRVVGNSCDIGAVEAGNFATMGCGLFCDGFETISDSDFVPGLWHGMSP